MANQQEGQKTPYTINFEERPALRNVGKMAYVTSNELCGVASEVFKSAFDDCEGTIFEVPQGGDPTISIIFNHNNYGEGSIVGVSRVGSKSIQNSTLNRIRNRDNYLRNGDSYVATEDLKDVVTGILTPRAYNQGKPNWGNIVREWSERNTNNMYMAQRQVPQYTKCGFVDISRLIKFIYGDKDENGENVSYIVQNAGAITPPGWNGMVPLQNRNYMLCIYTVLDKNVEEVYEKMGYGSMGSAIIR